MRAARDSSADGARRSAAPCTHRPKLRAELQDSGRVQQRLAAARIGGRTGPVAESLEQRPCVTWQSCAGMSLICNIGLAIIPYNRGRVVRMPRDDGGVRSKQCATRVKTFVAPQQPLGERFLKINQKISYAITAALSASTGTAFAAADLGAAGGVEEVVVTAQRRAESIQDVPITIQAITGDQLAQLNVTTFDDVLRYLPNVTFSPNGPGQGNIYMRGLSAGFAGNQSSASIAPFPNVATYLDEQSMTFPS